MGNITNHTLELKRLMDLMIQEQELSKRNTQKRRHPPIHNKQSISDL